MILSGTLEEARLNPGSTPLERGYLHKRVLISSPEGERPSPHAYLIEQSPDSFAKPHFHHNSEFQIITAGSGLLGRHEVKPFIVHYAGQQTGYGPIAAGSEGLSYLTLRPVMESGIWYLPESREYMDPRIRRHQISSACLPPCDEPELEARRDTAIDAVIEPAASGLAAWRVRMPPGAVLAPPAHANGAGRFYVVTCGSMLVGETRLVQLGTVWVSNEETGFELRAGERGLEALVMQFPANAWEFPDAPVLRESRVGAA